RVGKGRWGVGGADVISPKRTEKQGIVFWSSALASAAAKQEAGNLVEAAHLYERILSRIPQQPQALTMRASIAYQQGRDQAGDRYLDHAIDALTLALDEMPAQAPEHAGLANLLLARDRTTEAMRRLAAVDLPLKPVRATAADFHTRCARARLAMRPSILMVTMPKSASESLWNILAGGLDLGQCHVSIGLFPNCGLVPSRLRQMALGGVVAKEHIRPDPSNLAMLADAGIDRALVHVRDPRQAVLSWAHFVRNDVSRRMLAPIWRRIVPPAGVLQRDLDHVIDWCLDHYLPLLVDFVQGWHRLDRNPTPGRGGISIRCLTFERFVADRDGYLADLLDFYGLGSFNEAAVEQAATIHWRRGQIGEWRRVFTTDQRRRATNALPAALGEHFGWAP
ncbi:MAG: tetratricopeptide repeat protein, partial [Geminicoccaceae bacterium]